MMLVRLDTVPLAIQQLKLTLMDLQGAVGTLRLIKQECISVLCNGEAKQSSMEQVADN